MRDAHFLVEQDALANTFTITMPDDWNERTIPLPNGIVAAVYHHDELAYAWEIDPVLAHFFKAQGWVTEVAFRSSDGREQVRYILNERLFTSQNGMFILSLTLRIDFAPSDGRLVEDFSWLDKLPF